VIVRRKSRIAISCTLGLAVIAWATVGCRRKHPIPPSPPSPTKSRPAPDGQRPIDPTFLVLVGIESTPPGARIVRVSDGFVLGYTPETVEFHQSAEPVQIRFEMAGYIPVTREVSAASDGELKTVLEAIPKKHAPASRKSKGSRRHRNAG
jgi:hypothetical protein